MTTYATPSSTADRTVPAGAAKGYSILLDLIALLIIVQSVLAGVFLQHDGQRDRYASWVSAHGMVADTTIVLTLLATVLAFVKLRARRDLVAGTAALAVLLVVEGYIGGKIGGGSDSLTVVHIPLAMALMALTIWLVVRGIAVRRGNG